MDRRHPAKTPVTEGFATPGSRTRRGLGRLHPRCRHRHRDGSERVRAALMASQLVAELQLTDGWADAFAEHFAGARGLLAGRRTRSCSTTASTCSSWALAERR